MNKTDLKNLIREVVKEELQKIINEEFSKNFSSVIVDAIVKTHGNKSSSPKLTENKIESQIPTPSKVSLKEMYAVDEEAKNAEPPSPKKTFTKNGMLSDILNSTKPFGPAEKAGMASFLNDAAFQMTANPDFGIEQGAGESSTNLPIAEGIVNNTPSVLDYAKEMPDGLNKVFNRNYKGLMKAIDKHKKGIKE